MIKSSSKHWPGDKGIMALLILPVLAHHLLKMTLGATKSHNAIARQENRYLLEQPDFLLWYTNLIWPDHYSIQFCRGSANFITNTSKFLHSFYLTWSYAVLSTSSTLSRHRRPSARENSSPVNPRPWGFKYLSRCHISTQYKFFPCQSSCHANAKYIVQFIPMSF